MQHCHSILEHAAKLLYVLRLYVLLLFKVIKLRTPGQDLKPRPLDRYSRALRPL